MKKHAITLALAVQLTAIVFLLSSAFCWEHDVQNAQTRAVAGGGSEYGQNSGNDQIGSYVAGKITADTEAIGKKQANAAVNLNITGEMPTKEDAKSASAAFKHIQEASLSASSDKGLKKASIDAEGSGGSWANKNIENVGYAYSGNNGSFAKEKETVSGCAPVHLNPKYELSGTNSINYSDTPDGKKLEVNNDVSFKHTSPGLSSPSVDLSNVFGGGIYGYGTQAQGNGEGKLSEEKAGSEVGIIGSGIYEVGKSQSGNNFNIWSNAVTNVKTVTRR